MQSEFIKSATGSRTVAAYHPDTTTSTRFHLRFGAVRLVLCAFVAAAVSGCALGYPLDEAPTVRVSRADLDLRRETDARTLLTRIQRAARLACEGSGNFASFAIFYGASCREQAVEASVRRLNHPGVMALYNAKPAAVPGQLAGR